jgi:hypothetical protein
MTNIKVQLEWLQQLEEAQKNDEEFRRIKGKIQRNKRKEFHLNDNGLLCFRSRYGIPN